MNEPREMKQGLRGQRAYINLPDGRRIPMQHFDKVSFSIPGIRNFLNQYEASEEYIEAQYGPEVNLNPVDILRYVKGSTLEVVTG